MQYRELRSQLSSSDATASWFDRWLYMRRSSPLSSASFRSCAWICMRDNDTFRQCCRTGLTAQISVYGAPTFIPPFLITAVPSDQRYKKGNVLCSEYAKRGYTWSEGIPYIFYLMPEGKDSNSRNSLHTELYRDICTKLRMNCRARPAAKDSS